MATVQQLTTPSSATADEQLELLHSSVKAGTVALFVIAVAAAVGLIYLLKLVLVTVLLAFALDPVVVARARLRIPRAAGAAIALLLLLGLCLALTFFFYTRAVDFLEELPQYSATIRDDLRKLQTQADKFENRTRSILPAQNGKKPIPVQVQEAPGLTKMISAGASQYGDLALAISFTPFLIYFMLTWKNHVHSATLQVFPKEKRLVAYRTIGRISEMVRSFIAGNLLVGLLNAVASTAIFGVVHLPLLLLPGGDQRVRRTGSLSRAILRSACADRRWDGRARQIATGGRVHCSGRAARVDHEPALSKTDWQASAPQPAGGGLVATVLGVDLGSLRTGARDSAHGKHQNHLRLHRTSAGPGRVAGQLRRKASAHFRLNRSSTSNSER
jgi:hypothetical protein